jgi:hypothetical protein
MTSSLTSGLLNNWNAGEKLFGFSQTNQRDVYNLNNTLGSLAGQGVNFALTGDFALNVLNMSDLTGGKLKNGLLELHLGKNGATMNIGMGGADVSLGNIASAMGGLAVLDVNQRIDKYVRENKRDVAVTLRTQYGFGDGVQKGQLWDILRGDTLLAEGGVDKADAAAQTKREGDKRVVHITGYHDGMSKEEQFALGITLAHEAYRNGVDDGTLGQRLETNRAVLGHIGFANRMAQTYGIAAIGEQMAYEVLSYYKAQSGEKADLAAILSSYDASGDYWRVIKGKDGKVAKVIDDGDYEHINVYNANGKFEKRVGYQKDTSLVNAVMNAAEGLPAEKKGEPNWERVNRVMIESGLDYKGGKGWYAKTEEAKQAKEMALAERELATTVGIKKQNIFAKAAQGISDFISGVRDILKPAQEINNQVQKTILDTIGGWFKKPEKQDSKQTTKQQLSQEMIEKAFGLPKPSACAITSYVWMDGKYLESMGKGKTPEEAITLLKNSDQRGFNEKGRVTSYAEIGKSIDAGNYLEFYRDYNSLDQLQKDGINYYLIKYIHPDNPDRTHYNGYAQGVTYEPYTTPINPKDLWWLNEEKPPKKTYRAFKIKS